MPGGVPAKGGRTVTELEPVAPLDLAAQRARLGDRIERAIARVVEHGRFVMGPEVLELEERLAAFCGAPHAVSCSSGTDALLLALMAWGVGPGDAVFVPAFTFAASAEAIVLAGATPVFVDVDPVTFNLDVASLEAAVNADICLRPAGVIAVDLFGQPADYDAIRALAGEHGMWVLADAAQSFGSTLHGRGAGTYADAVATSFFPTKPLGGYGDGGAVFTADAGMADRLRSHRVHGQGEYAYDHVRIGITGRLDTIQAAVLLPKLDILGEEIEARQRLADRYSAALADVAVVPVIDPRATSAWAQYTVQVDCRDTVATRMAAGGVPTAVFYPKPLHRQPAYASFPVAPDGLPVAEALSPRVLSLPVHPYLTEGAQDRVIDALRRAVVELRTAGGSVRASGRTGP
jgi:dTDP-4-amino-4,6-dideoxygalactose transaminase